MRQLPDMAVLLIRLIGQEAALRMMEASAFGGREVYVPKDEKGQSDGMFAALEEIVGIANALALCKHFGNTRIYVPLMDDMQRHKRNQEIVSAYVSGKKNVWELVGEYHLSERQIRNILKQTDMSVDSAEMLEKAQQSLF